MLHIILSEIPSHHMSSGTMESPIDPDSNVALLLKEDIRNSPDLENVYHGDVQDGQEGEDLVMKKIRYSTQNIRSALVLRLPRQEGL